MRESKSACTKRVFPTPERPTKRTVRPELKSCLIALIASRALLPSSASGAKTLTLSSIRYLASGSLSRYAHAPYGFQPRMEAATLSFTHTPIEGYRSTQSAIRRESKKSNIPSVCMPASFTHSAILDFRAERELSETLSLVETITYALSSRSRLVIDSLIIPKGAISPAIFEGGNFSALT